ncbi:ECF transporter S component [Aeromicrobium sp. CF4.19]|uniref:ECF transporter S component n=1 Tax=Aeromicrobium sp. CF4.19 TaxID=3373082 RepID=UPI003EE462A7
MTAALRVGPRSAVTLAAASCVGLLMFAWPLVLRPAAGTDRVDPPFVFLVLMPVVIGVVVVELTEGGMDSKALAMLGVLTAINGALRTLGAGTSGVELVFFVLVLAGRVFGPGFGFALGCTSLFASALLTGAVGPWLPFQMMCAAWIGMAAGLLPRRVTGRWEIAMLVVYGVAVAYLFGALMNLWSWPFLLGVEGADADGGTLAFVPGAPLLENLRSFALYTVATSTATWDTGRAVTNAVAIVVLGPAILATLRRAARRARFAPA